MGGLEGTVAGLAIKPAHYVAMKEVEEVELTAEGIVGSAFATSVRRVTLLFEESWREVNAELGTRLPWVVRRANVLVAGLGPAQVLKRRVRLGEVELRLHGETRPCGRMDDAHPGLKNALKTECRGGVYGSVLRGGWIRVGDTLVILGESKDGIE